MTRPEVALDGQYAVLTGILLWLLLSVGSFGTALGYNLNGNRVGVGSGGEQGPAHVALDSNGGVYVGYVDGLGNSRVQRLTINGDPFPGWPVGGDSACPACAGSVWQGPPMLVADGHGGVFAAWTDGRGDGDIHLQHFRPDGSRAEGWPNAGKLVVNFPDKQELQNMIPDGEGGVIMTWFDNRRSGPHPYPGLIDIYAQRADSNGTMQWQGGGLPVRTDLDQTSFDASMRPYSMVTDGKGGAIFGFLGTQGLMAQHVTRPGNRAWTGDGVIISGWEFYNGTSGVQICSDGEGGILAGWSDQRFIGPGIYGQHILSDGSAGWDSGGKRLDEVPRSPIVISDGTGGGYFCWYTYPYGHVYVRRVGASGTAPGGWAGTAHDLTPTGTAGQLLTTIPDGLGGILLGWLDYPAGFAEPGDLRLGRLTPDGALAAGWPIGGKLVCSVPGGPGNASLGLDSAGGMVCTWLDNRDLEGSKVYAARVLLGGQVTPVVISGFGAESEDGAVQLRWQTFDTTLQNFRVERLGPEAPSPVVLGGRIEQSRSGAFALLDAQVLPGSEYSYELFFRAGLTWRSAGTVHIRTRDAFTILTAAHPNPSRGACSFEIRGTVGALGSVKIVDASGRVIRKLWSGHQDRPNVRLTWDGLGDHSDPQPGGVYFVRFESEGRVVTMRVAHLR